MDEPADAVGRARAITALLTTMADRCRDAAAADAAGVFVVTDRMQLEVVARSGDVSPFLDVLEMQIQQGPCVDSYRMNQAVAAHDLAERDVTRRWPSFAKAATAAGLRGADAVPMRMGHRVIGALGLLRCTSAAVDAAALSTVQSIAELTTIELLRTNADRHRRPWLLGRPLSGARIDRRCG
jgi:hypothetical protein